MKRNKIIIGLDLSTTSSGIAVYYKNSNTFDNYLGTSKQSDTLQDKIIDFSNYLDNLIIKLVCSEPCEIVLIKEKAPQYTLNAKVTNALNILSGAVYGVICNAHKLFEVTPQEGRKIISNHFKKPLPLGRENKKQGAVKLANEMNVRGETINSTNRAKITQAEITSDDIAEAMLIAKYGCLMNY